MAGDAAESLDGLEAQLEKAGAVRIGVAGSVGGKRAKVRVYAYDPAAMILTKASIDTSQLSASVTFLFGQGRLADEFSIEKIACKDCTGTLLQLTPLKPDPRFKRILLETDPSSAQVLRSTVIDPDGSENAITFKGLKTNTGVTETAFKLDTAEGTHVQDYTKLAAPAQKAASPSDGGAQ